MIVAISAADTSGNENCGKTVSITNEETGQSANAKVADLCPTCSSGDLDLSPAVFQSLGGTQEQGVFPISWSIDGVSNISASSTTSISLFNQQQQSGQTQNQQNQQPDGDGTATFYEPGLGSCGQVDTASDMIVAINSVQGSGNQHCGKTVTITNTDNGKSTTAKITDLCPTCSHGDLDLSPAVFQALGGTEQQGVFPISWSFS